MAIEDVLDLPPNFDGLAAPGDDGGVMTAPALDAYPAVLSTNRRRLAKFDDYSWQGVSTGELRRRFREAAGFELHGGPLIVSGHQPQLFHPGVWLKNFVAGAAAGIVGGQAAHVTIDGDLARGTGVRVPTGSLAAPRLETIAYDAPGPAVPFEVRRIENHAVFASFADRVMRAGGDFFPGAIAPEFWRRVVAASRETPLIGAAISFARRQWEERFGLASFEVPLSRLCRGEAFAWVVAHLAAQAPRLCHDYNAALADYRRRHKLRGRSHPVPALARAGEWVESPFWIWTAERPARRPLWVCRHGAETLLADRPDAGGPTLIRLALAAEGEGRAAADQLADILGDGRLAIRPRALTTTLTLRLLFGDVFVHGVGGAKYDRLTDDIVRRFFGCEPPLYAAASGTLRLDGPRPGVTDADVTRIDEQTRELTFHPEAHLDPTVLCDEQRREAECWIAQKRAAISQDPPRRRRKRRHEQIVKANRALQRLVDAGRRSLVAERERLTSLAAAQRILASREYSYILFREERLREWFSRKTETAP